MAQPSILSPGSKVGGKYEIVEVIGFGGMGLVYKVREQVGAVSRIRAVKTVLPQYATDAGIMARFRQEAEKMCLLEHENIVPVLSYSEEGEFPYLVMPFIEGQTLKDYLVSYVGEHGGQGLPLSQVMEIGLEVARGLEVAHGFVHQETRRPSPMVHRDIKPGNIMVRVENEGGERRLKVLIMDFGIAKVISGEDSGHTLTEVIGTVKYASPEQIRRGKDIDPRADIYSLGMVLYELYCGHHMFAGMSEHTMLMRMMQRDVKDHEIAFPEDTPERFRQLIQRCVAVDRERRFASVAELRTVMRRILEDDSERLSTEAEDALTFARAERSRALSAGAEEFAHAALGEAEDLLSQAEAVMSDRRFKDAIPTLRTVAERFARIALDASQGSERARLDRGLADLAEHRSAAHAAGASQLAAREWAAAEEATLALEKALSAGDLVAGARILPQAELAWQDAEARARRERLRLDAAAECSLLDGSLAQQRAEIARLPRRLREMAHRGDLDAAEAAAKAAHSAALAEDFSAAREHAAEGNAKLTAFRSRSDEALGQAVEELSARLSARVQALESSPHGDLAREDLTEVRALSDAAAQQMADRQLVEAVAQLEHCLSAVDRIETEVAARAAERESRLQAAERNRNAEGSAQQALGALADARAALSAAGPARGSEVEELHEASALAAAAEEKFRIGEFADALPPLREAADRLARLAAAISAREEQERLTARLTELRGRAMAASQELVTLGPEARSSAEGRRLLASFSVAEEHAARGDLGEALQLLEVSLPELEHHIAGVRAALERAREETEATAQRERAEHARESARQLGDRATGSEVFVQADARMKEGNASFAGGDFASASAAFVAATDAVEGLLAEIERSDRADRVVALNGRREALAARLADLPALRAVRRRRKALNKPIAAATAALERGDESEARRLLDELEASAEVLATEVANLAAAPAPARKIPWRAIGAGTGAAAALAVVVVLSRGRTPDTEVARQTPTVIPIMPRAADTPQIALAPTAVPTVLAPTPAPTAAVKPTEPAPAPTAVPRVEPTVIPRPPLALASAKPASASLKIPAGSEARFEASLKNADGASLEWRFGGKPVGQGRTLVLNRERTASPGKTKVEVIASRDSERVSLRAWDLEIEPPPIGFAKLEPAGGRIERPSGALVSFRAPIKNSDEEKLSFLWEVNGKPAGGIDGSRYDFRADSPGEYVVQVRATAPWGASIANTWKLSIKPPPTPSVVEELKKTAPRDAREEAGAWIQAYCSAFQRKDTNALLALGHLSSQNEASRLREALEAMRGLKVSCSNPSIRVNGDQAVVSFDRTDHWTDPRGTEIERALPRITKTLQWSNGRWVAAP
jgi:tRNA A-37 threonylcarbamoyl transferase component Bud32